MIATLQAICYYLIELLTPPEIRQIRLITRECVSKILLPTRDEDGYPISGPRCSSIIRFFPLKIKNETFFLIKNENALFFTL